MTRTEKENMVPVWERVTITLEEAAAYSGIGTRKLRSMTDDPECKFVVWVGTRRMIKRKVFDEYIADAYSV
jgi:excisionase family DNA binding protein